MFRRFFRSISFTVILSLIVTSIPSPFHAAWAQSLVSACLDSYGADRGTDPSCGAVRLATGAIVTYPKLAWTRISDAPAAKQETSSSIAPTAEAVNLANRSAVALGMTSEQLASAVQMFPSNVPFVFARFNPLNNTLRIDLFKLEKATVGGATRAGLYHATFSPRHGDFWKASKAYMDPTQRPTGTQAGLNPFEAFQCSSTGETFCNISLPGAQVAIGHAMRYAGAPLGVLSIADARLSQRQVTSGNAFRKKVTTYIDGHAKSAWMIAYPAQFQNRSSSQPMATYCANDPKATECYNYQIASAGVVFEDYTGGTLSNAEDTWNLETITQSGWGFLAILVMAVILSFAIGGLLAAGGLTGAGGAAGAATVTSGTAGATATGIFGSGLIAGGAIGTVSLGVSIAVEAAVIGGLMMLGGANLGSVMSFSPSAMLGISKTVQGWGSPVALDKYPQMLNDRHVAPRTVGDFSTGDSSQSLTGFATTVYGACAPGSQLANCVGATGIIQHSDQYLEQNQVQFLRDNAGKIIRNNSPLGPGQQF